MRIQKRVYLDEVHGERRRSSRYRVEAPVEFSWAGAGAGNEQRAAGWVLELNREWAYVSTKAEVALGTEVHAFVTLPPFGELRRILKIAFDATVERKDMRDKGDSSRGLALKISHLILVGDEDLWEIDENSCNTDVSAAGGRFEG